MAGHGSGLDVATAWQAVDPSKYGVKEYGLGVPLAVTNIIK